MTLYRRSHRDRSTISRFGPIVLTVICSLLFCSVPHPVDAEARSVKLQVAEIVTGFAETLPLDRKYVLKSLSPDVTGIPEDFLRRLLSDFEAGLIFASDGINLQNRQATEEIWQEAVEFNNTDFDALMAGNGADALLLLQPRLTKAGIEVSLTAYALGVEESGRVLAATGTSLLEIDVAASLGINVGDMNAKMDVLLERVGTAEKPAPLRAEVSYFRFIGNQKVSDEGCEMSSWADCFADGIGANVNGQDLVATDGVEGEWDEIFWEGDLDNDGYADALIRGNNMGNAVPPSWRIVSYRGEGRFEVYDLDRAYSWKEPRLIPEGPRWMIRVDSVSEGVGNTQLDASMTEVRLKDGAIVYKAVGSESRQFSDFEFTSAEAFEAYSAAPSMDFSYAWSGDFDTDGSEDKLTCGIWERWGRLWNCSAVINKVKYSLGDANCKIISLNIDTDGSPKFLCDGAPANLSSQ